MAETDPDDAVQADGQGPRKRGAKTLLISLVLALLLGGGGFYAVYSGLVPLGGGDHVDAAGKGKDGDMADAKARAKDDGADHHYDQPAFVALEPIVLSLGEEASSRHLRVGLTIEVVPGAEDSVTEAIPRINDVLNTFLRAVDQRDFEVPRAMMRLRAQMLRRVRLVSPPDTVRDLLFQEFVLN